MTEARLFVAVPLPDPARDAVARVAERVRAAAEDVRARWVRFDGLHLTLQFLGATPESAVPELRAAVTDVAARTRRFEVVLRGAGAFPNPARPRTLWVGLTAGADELVKLAGTVASEPRIARWIPDSSLDEARRASYSPHLTIARTDGVRGAGVLAEALRAEAAGLDARFVADRIVLYRSHLGGGPARYEPLAEAAFGG